MASLYTMINRLQQSGNLARSLKRDTLGRDVEEEKQLIEEARSDYYDEKTAGEIELARRREKSGIFDFGGTLLSGLLTGVGAVSPLVGTAIGGATSYLLKDKYIPDTIPQVINRLPSDMKFHAGAIRDQGRDIATTNLWFSEAARGSEMKRLVDSFSSAWQGADFATTFDLEDLLGGKPDRRLWRRTYPRQEAPEWMQELLEGGTSV